MITKIIKITFLIIWMIIIFMFSSQTGSESQYVSDALINKTVCINNSCNFDLVSFLIRKLAHFTLYFILGILVFINTKRSKEDILNAILFCIIYAFTDEMHQMLISNRSGELRDILIDSIGSYLGIILNYKLKRK